MLTLYLACLIGGGIFVGLSVFSGVDDGADLDVDQGLDLDAEVDVTLEGLEHGSVADASHGLRDARHRGERLWLPVMSLRFWTFGAAFFGMTGTVLTTLDLSAEPLTLTLSTLLGVSVGTASAAIVRMLRRPVGQQRLGAQHFTGTTGELLVRLKPHGVSKVRVHSGGGSHELLAVCDDGVELDKGAKVVVLGLDAEGRARVSPEAVVFGLEER